MKPLVRMLWEEKGCIPRSKSLWCVRDQGTCAKVDTARPRRAQAYKHKLEGGWALGQHLTSTPYFNLPPTSVPIKLVSASVDLTQQLYIVCIPRPISDFSEKEKDKYNTTSNPMAY